MEFDGILYEPTSWKDTLIKVCEAIYVAHSDEFEKCLTLRSNKRKYFSKSKNELFGNAPVQIAGSDYYVMTNFTVKPDRPADSFGHDPLRLR